MAMSSVIVVENSILLGLYLAKTCKYKANEWREEILTSEDFKQAYSVHPTTRYLISSKRQSHNDIIW